MGLADKTCWGPIGQPNLGPIGSPIRTQLGPNLVCCLGPVVFKYPFIIKSFKYLTAPTLTPHPGFHPWDSWNGLKKFSKSFCVYQHVIGYRFSQTSTLHPCIQPGDAWNGLKNLGRCILILHLSRSAHPRKRISVKILTSHLSIRAFTQKVIAIYGLKNFSKKFPHIPTCCYRLQIFPNFDFTSEHPDAQIQPFSGPVVYSYSGLSPLDPRIRPVLRKYKALFFKKHLKQYLKVYNIRNSRVGKCSHAVHHGMVQR